MREQQNPPNRTSNRNYDNDYKYLTPGAFRILTTVEDDDDDANPHDPPLAPQPFRLTPSTRRHKNASFAIIAEPSNSRSGSRSPSPTGRVSPFRGRGFNPIGSRHASPAPSPPPPLPSQTQSSSNHGRYYSSHQPSKIPTLSSRRGSGSVFGEKINDSVTANRRKKLNVQLSQSLTNISTNKKFTNRPPPSPRKNYPPAFQQLSPIVGSSPEPSQSQSSPQQQQSRIPTTTTTTKKSCSQPSSRLNSPTRHFKEFGSNRPISRTPSISKDLGNSRIPTSVNNNNNNNNKNNNNFRNVSAKVNSFNLKNNKPKVPPKPQTVNNNNNSNNKTNVNKKINNKLLDRNDSVKFRTENSKSNYRNLKNGDNVTNTTTNNNVTSPLPTASTSSSTTTNNSNNNNNRGVSTNKTTKNNQSNGNGVNERHETNEDDSQSRSSKNDPQSTTNSETNIVKLTDLLQPSTTTVVSSTTTTVTQPLKIDAKIDPEISNNFNPKTDTSMIAKSEGQTISPMVDGRVLSATSVSNAMNKMNDTVLNTQTIIKDHHHSGSLTRLSPTATAIIALSKDSNNKPAGTSDLANLETVDQNIKTSSSTSSNNIDDNTTKTDNSSRNVITNNNSNHRIDIGLMDSRILEQHVQNNMSKLLAPEIGGNTILEKAEILGMKNDAKPIRITVQEKPMLVEVQSGNIRIPVSATNGLNERPSLPPSHPSSDNISTTQENPPKKPNICTRFLDSCKNKVPGKCLKSKKPKEETKENEAKTGCFNCIRKKTSDIKINIEDDETEIKPKFWDRIKCCQGKKNKISDQSCFPLGKRKNSWVERRDSILSSPQAKRCCSKDCCTNILRKIFCCQNCCSRKKKVEENAASRRASMMSKKKSLTPSVPVEEHKPKIDASLVEHTSHMKAAIPILPVPLAWMCLVINCIVPGLGTIISGLLCLCIGKPRFSQKDGPRPRIGAFIIDLIIGCGQFFTVLFCLVGWGWSIWWGVIMLKIAKKHRKITLLEANSQEEQAGTTTRQGQPNVNHHNRDPGRGH